MVSFKDLKISSVLLDAIEKQGFTSPTEIQEKSIPMIVEKKDVVGLSSTGSGKTLAFGVGAIENAVKGAGLQALILAPTRELANQVAAEIKKFCRVKGLRVAVVYGGVSINPQISALKNAEIAIGTPGRLLDHMERKTIDLHNINTLVLDEADVMIDMGFVDDVERIIKMCPKERQTLMFSATMPQQLMHIAKRYMKSPVEANAVAYVDPKKLKQVYYDIPHSMKLSLLVHLLKSENQKLVMVFCNSRRTVDYVANNLKAQKIDAIAIHGGLSQAKRESVMKHFKSKNTYVLVCTDVAARGLDIQGISHVYNYDLPLDSKQYVHRIGRTARAGKDGKAISVLSDRDHDNFTRVLRDNDVQIDHEETPEVERIHTVRTADQRGRSSNGRRSFGGNRNRSPSGRGQPRSGGRPRSAGSGKPPFRRNRNSNAGGRSQRD